MILIVDDKPENLFALKKLLEVHSFNVDTASSGEEALKRVLKNSYALIILDVQMPGMDGFEVAEAISGFSKGKDIPIIFLSAVNTDKKFIVKGYSSGGIDYVTKPFDPDILLLKVKTFYRLYEQSRELSEMQVALRQEIEMRKRTQVEQYLKAKELKSILETIPQITFTTDAVGNIEYVNEQWYVYSDLKSIFPVAYENEEPVSSFWQTTFLAQPQLPVELCIRKQYNNEFRYHLLSLIPVKEDETILKWVGTITDIHEQKLSKDLLEKRVEERTSELIIANKELAFRNAEKRKRAAELLVANEELAFQNREKENRAAELQVANEELAFQNRQREKHEVELTKANRLYTFLSQINQSIVYSENEETVLKDACRIAIEFGKFETASITFIDKVTNKIRLVESQNIPDDDIPLFNDVIFDETGPRAHVVNTGRSFICNDIQNEFVLPGWQPYATKRKLQSCMMLPIAHSGEIIGTFNLFAAEKHFFDQQETILLEEAARDISFALGIFEKEKARKLSEYKVIHSELRLKQAQAIAHIGSWEEDISTGVESWSEEVCRIFGIPESENKQSYRSWRSFIHPEDLDFVTEKVAESKEKMCDAAFFHRIKRRNGEVRYIYSQSHFEFDETGKPTGKYGVVHDVTETNVAEVALAQSEANLRLIMDSIPQFIATRNIDGKFLFVNKSFADLMGKPAEELLAQSLYETLPVREQAAYYLKQDREVILSGKMKINPEHSFTDYKGDTRIFHTLKIPFLVTGTHERAILGITSDITEQKLAEKERTKMIADIVQRNKDLEQFSYIISHNLRAPVANIMGFSEVMQFTNISEEDRQLFISDLSVSVKKLDGVIKDINKVLQLKNEVSGKMEIVKFPELVADIRLNVSELLKNEEIQIESDFLAIDEMLTVKGYLYSIFYNLISNSIKYRNPDVRSFISIRSFKSGDKFQITFKDNGLGIDLTKRGGEVFGLYKRFHSHTEGKGMGLFMVKTQVETLGGTITVKSQVNEGTEFKVEFKS